ncbi:ARID DNA-binding domain-containing protein [Tanacetum coccineum]
MLKAKIKENEAYNTSGVCATLKQTRKDKRARCFACKERGHVVWNCPHKRNKMKGKIEASHSLVHANNKSTPRIGTRDYETTDFMVNGSGEKDWNRIWYISKEYKNHMTPVKSNFKRMKGEFKMLEKEERQRKSYFHMESGSCRFGNQERNKEEFAPAKGCQFAKTTVASEPMVRYLEEEANLSSMEQSRDAVLSVKWYCRSRTKKLM